MTQMQYSICFYPILAARQIICQSFRMSLKRFLDSSFKKESQEK